MKNTRSTVAAGMKTYTRIHKVKTGMGSYSRKSRYGNKWN